MKETKKYSLILASKSPRRREFFQWLNIPFDIHSKHIDEVSSFTDPFKVAEDIAAQKGKAVWDESANNPEFGKTFFPLVVSSDTVVALDDTIYGKPVDTDDARRMLKILSGKTHRVITSSYICFNNLTDNSFTERIFSCETKVTFGDISEDILEHYLLTNDSLDKAGSYGIQGPGLTFIRAVEGSYSNVVGFPIDHFIEQLKDVLGFAEDQKGEWRKLFHG